MKQPRTKVAYECTACATQTPKWGGQCPGCNAWNTLIEQQLEKTTGHRYESLAPPSQVVSMASVEAIDMDRFSSGSVEFDRVLGGGLVQGAVVLIGGDPGIGKSTLLLQTAVHVSQAHARVLYVSGEESLAQIALRAQRLGLGEASIDLLTEISLEKIIQVISERKPLFVVIDSIQTLFTDALNAAPGSVSQVRECAAQLTRCAKQGGSTLVMIGHVTKEGTLAGPRVLEHMVDAVLYFEGDSHSSFRLVRSFKNRFGSVNELGVFAMTERGLRAVPNPSALFLSQHAKPVPGSSVLITQEGSRPLLVEIQALLDASAGLQPRRLAVGLDAQRLALLLAVLHRHAGIACHDQDVFLNAVGGVRINEPAADLASLFAIVSSFKNKALAKGIAVFGEVGLAGEIRPCPRGQDRIREAAKLGYHRLIVPKANMPKTSTEGLTIVGVDRLDQALDALWS
ncbi:MAG: DNA repair protein RadA [Betaproteobacteria bacterium]|jgi:DNA repair protein RadA/Sms|nr:DNA repair protein RadA [Betaproteobacteria bacterium]